MSNDNQDQQGGKKIRKNFENNINFLKGLLESKKKGTLLKPSKVGNDQLDEVLDLIVEKRFEAARDKFIGKFEGVLDKVMAYNKFIAQKKKELEKLEEAEMKKINEEFNELTKEFADINALRQEAGKALQSILGEKEDEEKDDDEENKTD